ncbi:MAG TPA: DUF2877 domain-containing protein [Mycobacteriales bacterium]|nr:DUF2877 domain-containing protein [Mycobacteriales bacterium]
MKIVTSVSTAPAVDRLIRGQLCEGRNLGHGYLRFGTYVVALTWPGRPRMPNGIELASRVALYPGARVVVGEGLLRLPEIQVAPGKLWNPKPKVRFVPLIDGGTSWLQPSLVGWGPGLTPLGDDVILGYLAGGALFDHAVRPAPRVLPYRTNQLSTTLLAHAAHGELPEPAHDLIARGDIRTLLRFGHTSGKAILIGLAAAAVDCGVHPQDEPTKVRPVTLPLPYTMRTFTVSLYRWTQGSRDLAQSNRTSSSDQLVRASSRGS